MLAAVLHRLSPFLWEFREGFGIRWYGVAYVLSFLLGARLYRWLSERRLNPLEPSQVGDFITWGAVFGVMLGGRVGYMVLYDWERFCQEPLSVFRTWEGGMASHGGILGLVVFTFVWARRHRVSWTGIGDSLVVVAPVGLFMVRLANFVNGELYGRLSSVGWAMQFPQELREHPGLVEGTPLAGRPVDEIIALSRGDEGVAEVLRRILPARHPSQIYEALLEGVLLFVVLWVVRTRIRVPRGVLTGMFFVLYALLRIAGEQFREPEDFNFGMPRGVFLSLFLIAIGLGFGIGAFRRPEFEEGCR
ncbi:MAG: prolipoprotein diacylglyceryl transferase [Verrucomicrobiota bacterium]|jgi:phosphatidylglycerol:prolipoprotein diacylglycerol transferase